MHRSIGSTAAAALLVLAGSMTASMTASASTPTTPASTPASTPTSVAGDQVMPLTGQPVTDPAIAGRPALVVKIDNHPQARPQTGLNNADIVFEENVESLTRFAAVFHSEDADKVGPIRSARTQDIMLTGSLNGPLFAWSGGNRGVTAAVRASDVIDLGAPTHPGAYFRDRSRRVSLEHTLYSRTAALYALQPIFRPAPLPQFEYRAADDTPAGRDAPGAVVQMDNVKAEWTWTAFLGTYLRSQNGRAHDTVDRGQVNANNVVILEVEYRPSPANRISPEAQTIGTGKVTVLSAGKVVTGTWTRPELAAPFSLTADDGQLILLTPGRTWVELARSGATTVLPGATA